MSERRTTLRIVSLLTQAMTIAITATPSSVMPEQKEPQCGDGPDPLTDTPPRLAPEHVLEAGANTRPETYLPAPLPVTKGRRKGTRRARKRARVRRGSCR